MKFKPIFKEKTKFIVHWAQFVSVSGNSEAFYLRNWLSEPLYFQRFEQPFWHQPGFLRHAGIQIFSAAPKILNFKNITKRYFNRFESSWGWSIYWKSAWRSSKTALILLQMQNRNTVDICVSRKGLEIQLTHLAVQQKLHEFLKQFSCKSKYYERTLFCFTSV